MYHLTVVSGGGPNAGTQYEQLVQKLMETDGDPSELVLISRITNVIVTEHFHSLPVLLTNFSRLEIIYIVTQGLD